MRRAGSVCSTRHLSSSLINLISFPSLTAREEGTRATTMRYAKILREEHGFEVMPHLTCVGHTRDELLEILEDFAEAGFGNVMALRGDPPKEKERIPDCSRRAFLWLRPRFSHSRKLSRFWNRSGRLPGKTPRGSEQPNRLGQPQDQGGCGRRLHHHSAFFRQPSVLRFRNAMRGDGNPPCLFFPDCFPFCPSGKFDASATCANPDCLPASSKTSKPNPKKDKPRSEPVGTRTS